MSTCSPTVALVADTSSESPTSPGAVGGRACSRSRLIRGLTCAATAALPVSVTRTVSAPTSAIVSPCRAWKGPSFQWPERMARSRSSMRLGAGHRRVGIDAGALRAGHDHETVRGAQPEFDRERRRAPGPDGEQHFLTDRHLVAVEGDGQLRRPRLLQHGERPGGVTTNPWPLPCRRRAGPAAGSGWRAPRAPPSSGSARPARA